MPGTATSTGTVNRFSSRYPSCRDSASRSAAVFTIPRACTTPVRVHKLTGCPKILTDQGTMVSIKHTMSLKLFEVQTIINTLFLWRCTRCWWSLTRLALKEYKVLVIINTHVLDGIQGVGDHQYATSLKLNINTPCTWKCARCWWSSTCLVLEGVRGAGDGAGLGAEPEEQLCGRPPQEEIISEGSTCLWRVMGAQIVCCLGRTGKVICRLEYARMKNAYMNSYIMCSWVFRGLDWFN